MGISQIGYPEKEVWLHLRFFARGQGYMTVGHPLSILSALDVEETDQ
jgi:hypothetical protein